MIMAGFVTVQYLITIFLTLIKFSVRMNWQAGIYIAVHLAGVQLRPDHRETLRPAMLGDLVELWGQIWELIVRIVEKNMRCDPC